MKEIFIVNFYFVPSPLVCIFNTMYLPTNRIRVGVMQIAFHRFIHDSDVLKCFHYSKSEFMCIIKICSVELHYSLL